MAFGGKLNPKSLKGVLTQRGIEGRTLVDNKITSRVAPQAASYIGNNIAVSGTSDRNYIVWGGAFEFGPTIYGLTLTDASGNVIIAPGAGGNTVASNNVVGIGGRVTATGVGSVSLGNASNAVSTNSISLGSSAACSGHSGIAIGASSNAGSQSGIAIGASSSVNSKGGAVVIGMQAYADFEGQVVMGSTQHLTLGDTVSGFVPMYIRTTDATVTELKTSSGSSTTTPTGVIVLTNNSAYIFDCDIVARQASTGDTSTWNLKFAIKRGANAAATVLMGSPTATLIAQDAGASAWTVVVTADTTNGRPNISVTGEAAKTIRWLANIRMTKVSG